MKITPLVRSVFIIILLASCGFHLRQPPQLHFKTIFIEGNLDAATNRDIVQALTIDEGLTVTKNPMDAEVIVNISAPVPTRQILSLNAQGLVSQYTLYMRLKFRARDNEDNELLPPSELVANRILNYSDAQIYASQQEERNLNQDMKQDLILQMLRRLSSINPHSPQ